MNRNQYELYHHGVKGMRWGVRHDYKPNGRKRSKKSEDSDEKKFKLTDNQKKYIKIGAAVAGAALVTYGAYKLGAFDKVQTYGEEAVNGILEKASKTVTVKDAVKHVNPTHSKTNCRACSIASVLNLMGYKAEARNVSGGRLVDAVSKCFKGSKTVEVYSPTKDKVDSYILKKFGEGAKGVMAATYDAGGNAGVAFAHATSWAVENGQVKWFDGQKGMADCSKYFDMLRKTGMAQIARLDNLEIDFDSIGEFVKLR